MFRATITLCLALLLTITTRAQDKPSDIPLDNPFTAFSGPPVSETKFSGATVATIDNGDFVHPTFSPDGKVLAYSNVLMKGDFENTEIFLPAAVDPAGRRIAYCYWAGDKRHIVVKELN